MKIRQAGMVVLFLVLFAFVTPVLADSPVLLWQKSLGGSAEDNAVSIQPTEDGGYLVVGNTMSDNGDITFEHGMADVWVETERCGNLLAEDDRRVDG